MRRMLVVVLLALATFGSGWSVPKTKGSDQSHHVDVSAPAPDCVCYCGGERKYPGNISCMGGIKVRCQDRNGDGRNCGWDSLKKPNGDYQRCDGVCENFKDVN
jgi:hypothetical protein